jgi:glutamine synthetase
VAGPLVALNTILADSLQWIGDRLEEQLSTGAPLQEAAFAVLKRTMDEHGAVVFGGDGYSSEWHRKAVEERGLENLRTSADALPVLERPEIRDLFQRQGVLTPVELESRFEVYAEQYILAIEVEARLALRIARTQIYPVAMQSLERLSRSLRDQEAIGIQTDRGLAATIADLNSKLVQRSSALEEALGHPPHDTHGHLRHCSDTLMSLIGSLREAVDGLETLVDDDLWPLPTYQEMLFVR